MSIFELVKRSLLFYWRSNLGVLLTALVSTAVLTGALLVGDSVRYSLSQAVTERLGSTEFSLFTQDRFFRQKLADDIAKQLDTEAASLIQLRAMVSNGDGSIRANSVQVLGVDESFFKIGSAVSPFGSEQDEAVVLNRQLAEKIQVSPGDEIVLRIVRPGLIPRDIPLTPDSDLTTAFRLNVKSVADESAFGRFNLQANHIPPFNVFVPIKWLQEKIDRKDKANTLLVTQNRNNKIDINIVNQALKSSWQLSDTALELRELKDAGFYELYSDRVFIDPPLSKAAEKSGSEPVEVLTYFVNELKLNDNAAPYSMVSAVSKSLTGLIPGDLNDTDILINQWLADDLGAKIGDTIELAYFVVGPMRKLIEEKRSFHVRSIIPIEGLAADPNLMPKFPGISDVDNCRDWEPGIPVNLDKIRQKDEDYWNKYKGTPKAFVTISAGKSMWQNRYGDLTAVRYPLKDNTEAEIAANILNSAEPASIGLFFQPVRQQGLKAGTEGTDFGQLFIGFSFLIVTASVILTGLIFVFGVESRAEQIGMLKAIGIEAHSIKRLLIVEGCVIAVIGSALGAIAGLLYTKAMIFGLATIWRAAVSNADIKFHANPYTILTGAIASVAISLMAIWLTVRTLSRKPARELLAGQLKWQFLGAAKDTRIKTGLLTAVISAAAAVILVFSTAASGSKTMAGAFFGAGTLMLIAGLGTMHYILARIQHGLEKPMKSLSGLSLRNSTRRLGRSLAVAGLLACGVFLVVSVGANRQNPLLDADKRVSGTGGFALFAESSVAVLQDLNSPQARKKLALDEKLFEDADFVQFRVHQGDQASCFNLNRAQQPQLIGVKAKMLQDRNAFLFTKSIESKNGVSGWDLLNLDYGKDIVPAVGDEATIRWALGKSVGDKIEYSDSRGGKFNILLVGMVKNSIFQGNLIISEDKFIEYFPSDEGYRMFLVDSPQNKSDIVSKALSSGLRDFGMEITPAKDRLAAFSAVENTYISIFQMLGGLGLVIGSIGLGLVVLRNVLDRRGELAMLRAVGFSKNALQRMVFYEHGGLLLFGILAGVVAAVVAVGPILSSPGAKVPYLSLALMIALIGISGVIWIWFAVFFALSGKMLDALRNE